jgi:hypothetical protein
MTMSLSTAPVDVIRNNSSNVFRPPNKTTDSVNTNSTCCSSASTNGRQQLCIASELLFKSASKHNHDEVTQHTGHDTHGTIDILEATWGVACDGECSSGDFEDEESFVDEWDVPVKFSEATSSYEKLPEGPGKEEKREIMLDNLQSFRTMLDARRNGDGDDASCSSSEEEDDDFEVCLY